MVTGLLPELSVRPVPFAIRETRNDFSHPVIRRRHGRTRTERTRHRADAPIVRRATIADFCEGEHGVRLFGYANSGWVPPPLARNTKLCIIHSVKELYFRGSSLDDLRRFPPLVVREAGYQLDKVQHGEEPTDWKPMASIGAGVKEIRLRDEVGAFRVIYLAKLADAVHVLHCFQKKTQETSQTDIKLARKRFNDLMKEQR
jgi:phage-related protein